MDLNTPGIYVEETSNMPHIITEVSTAVPAFIGYTEFATNEGVDLTNTPTRITSLKEYEQHFGGDAPVTVTGSVDAANGYALHATLSRRYLYESLRLYFDNGGRECYVVSIGAYSATPERAHFEAGLAALEQIDEVTIIAAPDAVLLASDGFYAVQRLALEQCGKLKDRIAVLDLENRELNDSVTAFRNNIGTDSLSYGAAYAPWIRTAYDRHVPLSVLLALKVEGGAMFDPRNLLPANTNAGMHLRQAIEAILKNDAPAQLVRRLETALYERYPALGKIVQQITQDMSAVPPSGAIAGVMAQVDNNRGVWKAPANVALSGVTAPVVLINDVTQNSMNVDPVTGKSVNAIRTFTGKGTMVWGARTLAGNDNEWRYVNVRRFFICLEESIEKGTQWAVFEPNDAKLWASLKSTIENYLMQKWRQGALVGMKPEQAYFVHVGLGVTMTQQDIVDGKLIVEIGLAVVRPAEFVILRFTHKMQSSEGASA